MNIIVNIAIIMKEIDERNAVARSEKNPSLITHFVQNLGFFKTIRPFF